MRNRYASNEIVGILRAWNVNGDVGEVSALREAVKSGSLSIDDKVSLRGSEEPEMFRADG